MQNDKNEKPEDVEYDETRKKKVCVSNAMSPKKKRKNEKVSKSHSVK
jgi:hypothetical protein